MLAWIYLILAIFFEVAGTTCMKLADGFTKLTPSIFIFVFYSISFSLMTLALRRLDLSTAYAIWAGLGTSLVAMIGVYYFNEPMTLVKAISLLFVIIGVIGLRLGY